MGFVDRVLCSGNGSDTLVEQFFHCWLFAPRHLDVPLRKMQSTISESLLPVQPALESTIVMHALKEKRLQKGSQNAPKTRAVGETWEPVQDEWDGLGDLLGHSLSKDWKEKFGKPPKIHWSVLEGFGWKIGYCLLSFVDGQDRRKDSGGSLWEIFFLVIIP